MAMSKKALAERILRKFGYPVVKVELEWEHIFDAIDTARDMWMKWASGQATTEVWLTMMLSGGQQVYDLPVGVREVISYDSGSGLGDINTLFTLDNYLFSAGFYDGIVSLGSGRRFYSGYDIISYHINLDWLETLQRYCPETYTWRYHRYTNQISLYPTPASGSSLQVTDSNGNLVTADSPGWAMLRVSMVEGSDSVTGWAEGDSDEWFYGNKWITDYAEAIAKTILGRIRRKFENFASIGNTGIALDGGDLIQEGREDMQRLKEELILEESWAGGDIIIG